MSRSRWTLRLSILGNAVALIYLLFKTDGYFPSTPDYSMTSRSDGGYSLKIRGHRRSWIPITAEGPFPLQSVFGDIELIGPGKNWYYRGQNGFYYDLSNITSNHVYWEYGYAWVDSKREHIYLNLYWAVGPNGSLKSEFSGKYDIVNTP